jgi:hypothetical protein
MSQGAGPSDPAIPSAVDIGRRPDSSERRRLPPCGLYRLAPKAAAGITGAAGYSVRNLQSRYTPGAKTGKQARRTT